VDPNINQAVYPNRTYSYGLSTSLSYQLSRRSSLSLGYDQRYTDFPAGQQDLRDYTASARFGHRLTRDVGVHLGYSYGVAAVQGPTTLPVVQNIDVGVDYSKALSFARRTTFNFTTGTTMLANPSSTLSPQAGRRYFDITGSASLDHEMGRTWSARLSYRRGWQFVDTFATPFFTDGVTAALGGSTGRRTTLGLLAAYVHGAIGISGPGQHQSYSGSATYNLKLSRWSSAYAQYSFYQYEFADNTLSLPVGFPQSLDRHSVRIGFSISAPLLR
jgi:hypothetical protein